MESTIFTNMSRLRLVSIIIAVITVSSTFGLVSLLEEVTYTDESRASDASERDQMILAISLIPAFIAPAAIAGIVASFFKTVKKQIVIWFVVTLVLWIGFLILALMMLVYPVSFGIPENYWET